MNDNERARNFSKLQGQIRNQVREMIFSSPGKVTTLQNRPYTVCIITFQDTSAPGLINTDHLMGLGFSKVLTGDEWHPKRGREIATERAIDNLVEKIMDLTYPGVFDFSRRPHNPDNGKIPDDGMRLIDAESMAKILQASGVEVEVKE